MKKPGLLFKNNKRLEQLCFPLPNTLPQYIHDDDKPDDDDVLLDNTSSSENDEGTDDDDAKKDSTVPKVVVDHTAAWIKVLATSLGLSNTQIVRVWNPNNRKQQQSSSSWSFQSHQPTGTSVSVVYVFVWRRTLDSTRLMVS